MTRIYISGAITGREKEIYMADFAKAEELLTKEGYEVVNPAKINAMMPESTHEQYMHVSFAELETCDAIYMLMSWEMSKGAEMELYHAARLKMPILFEKKRGELEL